MSGINRFIDDPRLTAYALGELEGAERAEIEALVAKDDVSRRLVEEIRATATLVGAELGAAGGAALTVEQRARIAAKAGGPMPALRTRPILRMQPWHWISAAASVAAGVGIAVLLQGKKEHESSKLAAVPIGSGDRLAAGRVALRGRAEDAAEQESFANAAVVDRGAILKRPMGPSSGPVNPSEVIIPDFATATYSDARVAEVPNADPTAPENLPSGGTGGTSIGVGRVGHAGAGKPSGYKSRRDGAGGRGGGGLGQPAEPPAGPRPVLQAVAADGKSNEQLERLRALGYIGGDRGGDTASYAHVEDNPFRLVKDAPHSTFGVDVDTASYSNVRRFLMSNQLPPPGAVRIEEMVNYFPYDYAPPTDGRPFAVRVDVAGCPWKTDHRLVRVGIKGKVVEGHARQAANLVFLLDVSGSMQPANRLPLILQSMKLLVSKLEAKDRVAIVVYAGQSGLALPSTSCEEKGTILAALDALRAGGSTNGAAGIQLAYDIAMQNKIDGGVNRVILATDGDFNVGTTDESSLVTLIEEKRKSGVFLSVLGVGTDNYKDAQMEKLADRGNGNYAYIDTLKEGQKVLVEQANGTLVTIAKDVKLQLEFNPAQVGAYRLIGYENRVLAAEDFKDDKKDAGDIGAGHTVTALYEVVPAGVLTQTVGVDPLKYQTATAPAAGASYELLTVKLRWKEPNADVSVPMEVPVIDEGLTYSSASADFKFAASVAAFGMCLRNSPHKGNVTMDAILELAMEGAANDPGNYRKEFVELVSVAKKLGAK